MGKAMDTHMNICILGGNGNIGSAIARLALTEGHQVTVVTRSTGTRNLTDGVQHLVCDRDDAAALKQTLGGLKFDVVIDQVCFEVSQVEQLFSAMGDGIGHYIFTSSSQVYERPFQYLPITEDHPCERAKELGTGYRKRKVEKYLLGLKAQGKGPNFTIIRPSLTFDKEILLIGFLAKDYTLIHRLENQLPLMCPNAGQSAWTITHSDDIATGYVGCVGNSKTYGETYHLTSDHYYTWETIFRTAAKVFNTPQPNLVFINGDDLPKLVPDDPRIKIMKTDKQYAAIFDNRKAKRDIPSFKAAATLEDILLQTKEWFAQNPDKQTIDNEAMALEDKICQIYANAHQKFIEQAAAEIAAS